MSQHNFWLGFWCGMGMMLLLFITGIGISCAHVLNHLSPNGG